MFTFVFDIRTQTSLDRGSWMLPSLEVDGGNIKEISIKEEIKVARASNTMSTFSYRQGVQNITHTPRVTSTSARSS
jgi:hypothetical protein